YVYHAIYATPAQFGQAFGAYGLAGEIAADREALEISVQHVWRGTLMSWVPHGNGLGGWDLSVHHFYNPIGRTLFLGDGTKLSKAASRVAGILTDVAGGLGDDLTTQARVALNTPRGVAVGPDGALYIADSGNDRIRKVTP